MEAGAIVGVTVQGADQGDTTIAETLTAAAEDLEAVAAVTADDTGVINEVVADKGYHSNQVLTDLAALDLRGYIAEPDRGRRNWTKNAVARDALYARQLVAKTKYRYRRTLNRSATESGGTSQGRVVAVLTLVGALWTRLIDFWRPFDTPLIDHSSVCPMQDRFEQFPRRRVRMGRLTTGC